MKIDNDIRLFLPNEYKYILYGGNFLFSKRFYEIAKRTKSIKRVDYRGKLDSVLKIKSLIKYCNIKTFIFTSELLSQLSKTEQDEFYQGLLNITSVKFIFINIGKETSFTKNIIKKLDRDKDLIYSFDKFLTYVISNIEQNPLYDRDYKLIEGVHLADDLINNLLDKLNNVGSISANKTTRSKEEVFNYVTQQSKAALNLIYKKNPYEIVNNKSVAEWRMLLGKSLCESISKKIIKELDLILPVPETGKTYAQGISSFSSIPYVEALYKKADIGRSFDIEDVNIRKEFIKTKLGLIKSLVKGKTVGVVDEAIFTGMTLKEVCKLLVDAEVGKIYLLIPTPECTNTCIYNIQPDRDFLSSSFTKEELKSYFKVEDVVFQNFYIFKNIMEESGFNYLCCFSNE